jgi:DNA-binding YbaB/EbfC family protein
MVNPLQMREMLANAQKMQQDLQSKLEETVVEASSGGGMVTARMNGKKQLLGLRIEPSVVDPKDVELLQDLVTAAINEAGRKADEAMQSGISGMLGGLNIPGLG